MEVTMRYPMKSYGEITRDFLRSVYNASVAKVTGHPLALGDKYPQRDPWIESRREYRQLIRGLRKNQKTTVK
jgi:hypothetical protein